jgi:uncharacterized membrane protein
MPLLILAALVWILLHLGLAGTTARDAAVQRIGERGFRGVFALLSILALIFLARAFNAAPTSVLWVAPDWLRWLLVLAMLPAFVLFVGSVSRPNPTMIGPVGGDQPPRGVTRVTRHPMLWSFAIWAVVHILGNGDTAAIVFFGTFLVTALAGMPSIDAKLARRDPNTWQAMSAVTSVVPFVAIVQGRNLFVPKEIGWRTPAIGAAAWIVLLLVHPWLFGVSPAEP